MYLRRYSCPTCAVFFTRSSFFVWPKPRKSCFALTKHVNAVSLKLHWTACWKKMPLTLHGNFAEISAGYLFSSLTFLQTVYLLFFPNYLIGGSVQCNLIAYCAQCNAYFALCAQKKNKCTVFSSLHALWVSDPYMWVLKLKALWIILSWNLQYSEGIA